MWSGVEAHRFTCNEKVIVRFLVAGLQTVAGQTGVRRKH
jgi:hypothetical protein